MNFEMFAHVNTFSNLNSFTLEGALIYSLHLHFRHNTKLLSAQRKILYAVKWEVVNMKRAQMLNSKTFISALKTSLRTKHSEYTCVLKIKHGRRV